MSPNKTTESVALIALEDGVPPPLSPLTDVVISPANIAAEQRRQRARTLSWSERRRIKSELRQVSRKLKRNDFTALMVRRHELRSELHVVKSKIIELKQQNAPAHAALQQRGKAMLLALRHTESALRKVAPVARRQHELSQLLTDHDIAIARIAAEDRIRKMMRREAQIYEALIVDKWTRLGFCHRYTENGKERVDKVTFSEVTITLDAIYYKIDASYQTAFRAWKTNLPEGVYIAKQLLADDTLAEISITCQRQVSGTYNHNGAWVIVHRLESTDGLMNYVSFNDVISRYPAQHHTRMPICVGVANNRQVQWVNLADFPHWLIGGYTNSGKSNMINAGLSTLIQKQHPDDLRLVLIDLKGGLEFDFYSEVPHLHGGIVSTVNQVAETLASLEAMMHARFARFRGIAKRLETYHAKRPDDPMPRVLCVFDEVASIMDHGEATKRILASLRELTRMGRAVGIHIWLCTQRPDIKAIDGAIKANLAVRISGRMSTSADSVTILGNAQARDLAPVAGRMIMQLGPDPVAIQTPHVTDENLSETIRYAATLQMPRPLDVPEVSIVHQQWTPESIIELSLKHGGGNITARYVYENAEGLSKQQARRLVERVWNMDRIEFEGKLYRVQVGRSNRRVLVEAEENDDADTLDV